MDVGSTTSTTSTSAVSNTQNVNTQSTSNNSKTENKTSASFDEEMKNAKKETEPQKKQTVDKQEKKTDLHIEKNDEQKALNNVKENILAKNINENINEKKELNPSDILTLNIQNLIDAQNVISGKNDVFEISIRTDVDLTKNIGETLDYQDIEMNEQDAIFFADVVQNNNGGIQNIVAEIQQAVITGDENVQKSATVSKALLDALQNTVKTGQAVRVDFGNDIAVIMRVSKDGSIMANFIPGDKAVENYLKNNIDFLRQRFDEEDIPYSQLSYSQHQNRERRQQNKEDKNE